MADTSSKQSVSWIHRLQFRIFSAAELVIRLLPIEVVIRLGRCLGWCAYWITGKYRRLAKENLGIAFSGEWTERQISDTARSHFVHLGGNLLAGFKLPLMPEAEILKRVTSEGTEHVLAADSAGRNIVYAVFHLSCWELLTQVPSLYVFGRTPGSVFQPLANPLINETVLQRRQKLGYRLFDRSEGFSGPMKFVREGGCLGVLVDQHAGDHGVWSPFFNRLASTTPLAALIAKRANALLLPILIQTNGVGRWKLKILPPVCGQTVDSSDGVEQTTAKINQVAEQVIRENPADWFWVHNRWKTPKPNFLLGNYRRGIALPQDSSPDDLKKFEVIVRSPNWLGDACMALPAIRALKGGRPDLRLTVFGPEKLRGLWRSQPEVEDYIGKNDGEGLLAVSQRIKATKVKFDAGILFTNSTRSTLEFWLAGIGRLVGQKGSMRSGLLNQICPESPKSSRPLHHAAKYLRIITHAGGLDSGIEALDQGGQEPKNREAAQPIKIGLCAGAEYGPAKRWPLERFAEVANRISEQLSPIVGIEWMLFGAPGESAMGESLSSQIRVTHQNRVGKTSLEGLISELRTCDLLLTNDTGTMHLAAALGVRTVSIFGSTEPSLTGPLGPQHHILRHHVPCSPCFKRECPMGHYDCMKGITVEQVVGSVVRIYQSGRTVDSKPAQT